MKKYLGLLKKRVAILLAVSMVMAFPYTGYAETIPETVNEEISNQEPAQEEQVNEVIENNEEEPEAPVAGGEENNSQTPEENTNQNSENESVNNPEDNQDGNEEGETQNNQGEGAGQKGEEDTSDDNEVILDEETEEDDASEEEMDELNLLLAELGASQDVWKVASDNNIYISNRKDELHVEVEGNGIDYDYLKNINNNQDLVGGITYDSVTGINSIDINILTDDAWNYLYEHRLPGRGMNLVLYLDEPDSSVKKGMTTGGDDCFSSEWKTVDMAKESAWSNNTCDYRNISQLEKETVQYAMMETVGLNTVLNPTSTSGLMLAYSWLTDEDEHYNYASGSNPYVEHDTAVEIEVFRYEFKVNYTGSVTVDTDKTVPIAWIATDSELSFIKNTVYSNGALIYYLDYESAKNSYPGKQITTRVNLPQDADIVDVSFYDQAGLASYSQSTIVSIASVSNQRDVVDISIRIDDPENGKMVDADKANFRITYSLNGKTETVSIGVDYVMETPQPFLEQAGFLRIPNDRIEIPDDLKRETSNDRGYKIEYVDGSVGELKTVWTGKEIDTDNLDYNIIITPPATTSNLKKYYATHLVGDYFYRYSPRDAQYLKNATSRDNIPEENRLSLRYEFTPEPFSVPIDSNNSINVYRIHTNKERVEDYAAWVIIWEYDNGECIYEYFYSTSRTTDFNLSSDIHDNSGLPIPEFVSATNEDVKDIAVENFSHGRMEEGLGCDYYRIVPVNVYGEEVASPGNVEIKYSYPTDITRENAEENGFVLKHFEDTTHQNYVNEDVRFENDGIHVVLNHFSPFLLSWGGDEGGGEYNPEPLEITLASGSLPDGYITLGAEREIVSIDFDYWGKRNVSIVKIYATNSQGDRREQGDCDLEVILKLPDDLDPSEVTLFKKIPDDTVQCEMTCYKGEIYAKIDGLGEYWLFEFNDGYSPLSYTCNDSLPIGYSSLSLETKNDWLKYLDVESIDLCVSVTDGNDNWRDDLDCNLYVSFIAPYGMDIDKIKLIQPLGNGQYTTKDFNKNGRELTAHFDYLGQYILVEWEGELPWDIIFGEASAQNAVDPDALKNADMSQEQKDEIDKVAQSFTNNNVNDDILSDMKDSVDLAKIGATLGNALEQNTESELQLSLNNQLLVIEFSDASSSVPSKLTYDIEAILKVVSSTGAELATGDAPINSKGITFRIWLPSSVNSPYAYIYHKHTNSNTTPETVTTTKYHLPIKEENGEKYVELTVYGFSEFTVVPTNEAPASNNEESNATRRRSYSSGRSSSGRKSSSATYSSFWEQDATGAWRVKNKSGQYVLNAWLCDSAIKANGINVWYLLGADGIMVTAGLIQDKTGNFYSLETAHNGYYGSLRYINGYYNCNGIMVYLEFEQTHNGSFGAIKNADGIAKLKEIYGVTQYGVDNSNCQYTSNF